MKCFLGFMEPFSFGGPENSLTGWGDQGAPETLCDYGTVYTFMEYLQSHYGNAFMKDLHLAEGNGLQGLDSVLRKYHGPSAQETVHNWAAAMALDAAIDGATGKVKGGDANALTARTLSAKINWDNPQAYDSPGAPANGSDYVRLRNAAGSYLSGQQIRSIEFQGAKTLEPTPVEWTVDATPPTDSTATSCVEPAAGAAPAALYSGCGDNLDRSIAREVTVPAAGGQLTFDALWNTEQDWDFGYVQVSTDGGKTWTSLATQDTTSQHDPGAIPQVVDNLPGFNGDSGGWRAQSADLSAYAGKTVLLAFRYITDPGTTGAGFWVRNINVAGTALPTSLDGWKTPSQINPTAVSGFTVQLISYTPGDRNTKPQIYRLPLDANFSGRLPNPPIQSTLGKGTVVAAIVTYDEPTETINQQARYTLKVNGAVQPGG